MQSYSSAIQHYTEAESPDKVAQNYVSAAEIMLDYNNESKALSMLRKAQSFAEKAGDEALKQEIGKKLAAVNV